MQTIIGNMARIPKTWVLVAQQRTPLGAKIYQMPSGEQIKVYPPVPPGYSKSLPPGYPVNLSGPSTGLTAVQIMGSGSPKAPPVKGFDLVGEPTVPPGYTDWFWDSPNQKWVAVPPGQGKEEGYAGKHYISIEEPAYNPDEIKLQGFGAAEPQPSSGSLLGIAAGPVETILTTKPSRPLRSSDNLGKVSGSTGGGLPGSRIVKVVGR